MQESKGRTNRPDERPVIYAVREDHMTEAQAARTFAPMPQTGYSAAKGGIHCLGVFPIFFDFLLAIF